MSAALKLDFREDIAIDRLLIWVYMRQRAHVVIGAGAGLESVEAAVDGVAIRGRSACGCAVIERNHRVGVAIAGTAPSGALHEDAEIVHRVVSQRTMGPLIIRHAAIGETPDWIPEARLKAMPLSGKNGKPRVEYENWDRSRNYGFCPVWRAATWQQVERERAVYSAWHEALEDIAFVLMMADPLRKYRVRPPEARRAPWERTKFA